MVVVILILSGGLVWIRTAELKAIDAAEVASKEKQTAFDAARIASDERRKALAAARDSRYETLAQILMRILWTTHQRGWSDEAKTAIDETAGICVDDRQKTLAMSVRRGLDAHLVDSNAPAEKRSASIPSMTGC